MKAERRVIIEQLNTALLKYKELADLSYPAQGLDCVFIYAFIPNSSVSEIIRKQAEKIVRKRFERVTASMVLEDQEVYGDEKHKSYELAIEKIIDQMDKTFWDY